MTKNRFILIGSFFSACVFIFFVFYNDKHTEPMASIQQVKKIQSKIAKKTLNIDIAESHEIESKPVLKLQKIETKNVLVFPSTPRLADSLPLTSSLEGTSIDGQLRADADGHLIINLSVRDFFEYFLNTQSEIGIDASINEILRYAKTYLPESAFLETKKLLEKYVEYKHFDLELRKTPIDPNRKMLEQDYILLLKSSFLSLSTVRKELFTEEVNSAFFKAEDAFADFTLKTLEIQSNPDLSFDERQAQINLNRAVLSEEMFNSEADLEYQEYKENEVKKLLSSSRDEADIQENLIKHGYSEDNIDEILLYEKQQKDFNKRFEAYKKVRDEIALRQLPEDELLDLLSLERNQYFISNEEKTKAHLKDLGELDLSSKL